MAGHVAAAAVDAGHQLLAGEAPLVKLTGRVDHPLAGLGRDGVLDRLRAHGRHTVVDAQRLVPDRVELPSASSGAGVAEQVDAVESRPSIGATAVGALAADRQRRHRPLEAQLAPGAELEPLEPGDDRFTPALVDVELVVVVSVANT